jgi:adenine phosphoribosyltransferase
MMDLDLIKEAVRTIPDYPKPGVLFRDVTTLLKDAKAYSATCEALVLFAKAFPSFEYVAGIESRGFIFGAVLAQMLGKGFIPVRKPGKLPAKVQTEDYDLEYGADTVEVHVDAIRAGQRCLVLDDLLATGGTANAACRLIEKCGGVVAGCLFVIELTDLNGRQKLENRKISSIVQFEGE